MPCDAPVMMATFCSLLMITLVDFPACGIAAVSPSGLMRINLGYLTGWLNCRRPADILPAAGRMRAPVRISARRPQLTVLRTRRAGGHRSLIASLGSSPLGELFHACVLDGSCAYQVSVLSGVGIDRPMMVSEVPASECQLHRQQMPCQETTNAAVEERCPSASAEPDPNPQRHAPRPVHRLVSGHARQRCPDRALRCLAACRTGVFSQAFR